MKKLNNVKSDNKIQKILSDDKKLTAIIRKAVKEAVGEHLRTGNPVATLKNGKVVWIEAK
jgi:hypothetical protein